MTVKHKDMAVAAMVDRIIGPHKRSFMWGYEDGREWGLREATRADLEVGRKMASATGDGLLRPDGLAWIEELYVAAGGHIPGLDWGDAIGEARKRFILEAMAQHAVPLGRHDEDEPAEYIEGWCQALEHLCDTLEEANNYWRENKVRIVTGQDEECEKR